jgi:predicted nucleic acid-binding protein
MRIVCDTNVLVSGFVSGDDHLLALKEFRGIRIVSPASFIKKFRK